MAVAVVVAVRGARTGMVFLSICWLCFNYRPRLDLILSLMSEFLNSIAEAPKFVTFFAWLTDKWFSFSGGGI